MNSPRHHARLAVLLVLPVALSCGPKDEGATYPTTPFDAKTLEQLHEIRDEVSRIRQLDRNPEVDEGWISSRDYADYMESEFAKMDEEDLRDVAAADTVLKLLGILGPHDSYYEQALDISANEIAGFYDPDTDQLVLVGGNGALGRFNRSTLAHEYVHSFQVALTKKHGWDERYGSGDDEKEHGSFDYDNTLACLIEGDAELAKTHFDGESVEGPWYSDVEYMSWMERNFYFNYSACTAFVDAVYQRGGWDAVDGVYADPPVSIEQVMHPAKYFSHEPPADLQKADLSEALGEGWVQLDSAVFNEFDGWNLLLQFTSDTDLATSAAAGWGMGWIGLYCGGENGPIVGHVSLQFDGREDLGEFEMAFAQVVRELGGTGRGSWANETGSGWAGWDRSNNRVDIVVSTDRAALDSAVKALGYQSSEAAANTGSAPPR